MTGDLTADEIYSLLQLEPNATCGFVRVTYSSKQSIMPGGAGVVCGRAAAWLRTLFHDDADRAGAAA